MSTVDAAIIKYITKGVLNGANNSSTPTNSCKCVPYTAGDGININGDNVINIEYNTDTMELVDGKLSVKAGGESTGGSGSSTPEDVLTRFAWQQYGKIVDSDYELFFSGKCMITPSVVKLYNKNTQTIDTLYLIMFRREIYPPGDTTDNNNAWLMDADGSKYFARIFMDGGDMRIRIKNAATTFDTYGIDATDVGLYEFTNLSYDTLMFFLCNSPIAYQ